MNSGFEAVWLYIKALLPPGLEGALEPGGRENGIIPTNFHGLDFEIFGEPFGLVVEQASGDERNFRDDDFEDWIVDKVLRAWLEETDFYRHLIISAGRVFWFNPNEDPERATLLVDVNPKGCWRSTQARLQKFIRENLGPRYQDLSSDPVLFDRVFKKVPIRWSTFYDLRKRFEDDLDSLTAFIKEYQAKKEQR